MMTRASRCSQRMLGCGLTSERRSLLFGSHRGLCTLLVQRVHSERPLALISSNSFRFMDTKSPHQGIQRSLFHSESAFHDAADNFLDEIQDAIDELFEPTDLEVEASLASGVLTLGFPPHGIWVINKQTPNQQIWWSSPISGPQRYEYKECRWVYTRSINGDGKATTLANTLKEEIKQLYDMDLELDP